MSATQMSQEPRLTFGRTLGIGMALAPGTKPTPPVPTYATDVDQPGMLLGQVVIAILAVLMVTGEYTSGEIRTSLLAVPPRWPVAAAKTAIAVATAFVVTVVPGYVVTLCGWPLQRKFAVDDRFTGTGVRVIAGAGLAVALVACMAIGIGVLVRSGAASIAVIVLVTIVVPNILTSVPVHWLDTVSGYLIGNSIQGLMAVPAQIDPTQGVFTFGKALWISALWAVVPLAAGLAVLRRRDA